MKILNPIKIAINCCNVGGGGGGGGGGWRGPEFEVPCGPPACTVVGTANTSAPTRHNVVRTIFSFFTVFLLLGYRRDVTTALGLSGVLT